VHHTRNCTTVGILSGKWWTLVKDTLYSNCDSYACIRLVYLHCGCLFIVRFGLSTLSKYDVSSEAFRIISECQYGFSLLKTLCRAIHDFVALNLNNEKQTDVIMLNIWKAFDNVSYCFLLHYYGTQGPVLQLISAFLDGYAQSIVLWFYINLIKCYWWCTSRDGIKSLMYINDLPDC